MSNQLDAGAKHLLRLVQRGAGNDGWANVSKPIWPHFKRLVPEDLFEWFERGDGTVRVRLTERGEAIADYA